MRVCIFCGANRGADPAYAASAEALARALVAEGIGIVYGGGNIGLMGLVADVARIDAGEVIGVIPEALMNKELGHPALSELHVVASMHERKAAMAELADAFVALPGGLGTFEELLEILTWAQLGLHAKPIVVFDVNDYYEPLFALLDHGVAAGFLRQEHRALARRATTVDEVLVALRRPVRPAPHKWIDRDQT